MRLERVLLTTESVQALARQPGASAIGSLAQIALLAKQQTDCRICGSTRAERRFGRGHFFAMIPQLIRDVPAIKKLLGADVVVIAGPEGQREYR